jgi:hypothetical protein
VAAARVVSGGLHTWRLRLADFPAATPPVIGLAPAGVRFKNAEEVGQVAGTLAWGDGKLRTPTHAPAAFGPALRPGDVVTVELDTRLGTVRFFRNRACVGVAFGPAELGAVLEVPFAVLGGSVAHRLAVSVAGQTTVRILAPDTLAHDDPSPLGGVPALFAPNAADAAAQSLEKVGSHVMLMMLMHGPGLRRRYTRT